jgi:fructose-bisphosphate aldolase class II
MIKSTLALARHGQENGYAVPAVNVFDHVSLRAVVGAAVDHSSPLIVQVSVKTVREVGLTLMTEMFRAVASEAPVPLALHLDHCPDLAVARSVIHAGWSSLLLDMSASPLDEALRETAQIVELAHAAGLDVESEIENILGVEDGVGSNEAGNGYSIETLVDAAERTGADLLAPQLGTAHGVYKAPPILTPERAQNLVRLSGRPVVLHGGTGLTDQDFRRFIDAGVSKINISTAVKVSYVAGLRETLDGSTGATDPLRLLRAAGQSVRSEIGKHIKIFGSDGHASAAGAFGVTR